MGKSIYIHSLFGVLVRQMAAGQVVEEVVIPKDLKDFLGDVVEGRHGYKLGEPWKYSDKALAVVVPIIRENAPRRAYITMYEVLKEMGMKDTGSIDKVELQNRTGKPVFVRVGTIFTGATQNRAAQHSGVYQEGKANVFVKCVQQTHGIQSGAPMEFGDIAPLSITMNLMADMDQSAVWESVRRYTGGDHSQHVVRSTPRRERSSRTAPVSHRMTEPSFHRLSSSVQYSQQASSGRRKSLWGNSIDDQPKAQVNTGDDQGYNFCGFMSTVSDGFSNGISGTGSDDLLGHLKGLDEGKKMLDDMMQKVPLFPDQVGAIIFSPLGVAVVETFDHPKSWEAIKKEIIEKHGDKICQEQADHLFELKPEMIMPAFKKFVDGLVVFKEQTIRKDDMSETRALVGQGIVGEYTLMKGRVVHTILAKENN